jgi:hypothetical protein
VHGRLVPPRDFRAAVGGLKFRSLGPAAHRRRNHSGIDSIAELHEAGEQISQSQADHRPDCTNDKDENNAVNERADHVVAPEC